MEKEIARVVPGRNGLYKRTELTDSELKAVRLQYLTDADELVALIRTKVMDERKVEILMEKMLSPFNYWLEDKLASDQANKIKGNGDVEERAKRFARRIGTVPDDIKQ